MQQNSWISLCQAVGDAPTCNKQYVSVAVFRNQVLHLNTSLVAPRPATSYVIMIFLEDYGQQQSCMAPVYFS